MEDERLVAAAHLLDNPTGAGHPRDRGEPRASGLLGGLAGMGPPSIRATPGPLALPCHNTSLCRPGNDLVDTDFGEHGDSSLGAFPLDEGQHNDQPRSRGLLDRVAGDDKVKVVPAGMAAYDGHHAVTTTIDEVHALPGPQAAHADGVASFSAAKRDGLAGDDSGENRLIGEEDGRRHFAVKASLIRLKKPLSL